MKKLLSKAKIAATNKTAKRFQSSEEKILKEKNEKQKIPKEKKTPKAKTKKETTSKKPLPVAPVLEKKTKSVKPLKTKQAAPAVKKEKKTRAYKEPTISEDKKESFEIQEERKEEQVEKQVLKVLDGSFQTPILQVKYSSVKTPYYFNNNKDVPRYSITLILDEKKDKKFIQSVEAVRKQYEAEDFRVPIKFTNEKGFLIPTGKSLIKFQTKNKIPIYDLNGTELELTGEIPEKTKVSVVFEIRCYLNKRSNCNAFNLSPSQVIIHVTAEENSGNEKKE